jgi:hypothetical protein
LYDAAQKVEQTPEGIRLLGPKKLDYRLERSDCMFMLESSELAISSGVEWPFRGYRDNSSEKSPHARRSVYGTFSQIDSVTFAFKQTEFLGRIKKFTLECHEDTADYIASTIWGGAADDFAEDLTLHIAIRLSAEHFKEIFHPIWVRQSKSVLHLHIDCAGYRSGPEASFSDPGDIRNYVLDASQPVKTEFLSISLRTSLGAESQKD